MTPEQRLKRAENVLRMLVRAGRRARDQWGQKVNILIDAQIATEEVIRSAGEQIKHLAIGQVRLENEMVELARSQKLSEQSLRVEMAALARSQKLTDRALRAFINSQRKGRNGSSN
jgi:hypothetical protein